jgi:hypothetical protein
MIYNLFSMHWRLLMLTRSRLAALVLLTFAALPAAAQEFGPAILPTDTSFFVYSHGTAHAESAYAANPMVQSWTSPEFVQFRDQGINYFTRHSDWKASGHPVKFTPAEAEQIYSFLTSPMILGFSGSMDVGSIFKASTPSAKEFMNSGGIFFILDVTGKTAPFDLLFKVIEANVPKEIIRSRGESGGISMEKFAGPNNTSFAARVGNYFVWSNQQKLISDLISRLGSHSSPTSSLTQDATFQRCRSNPDPDAIYEVYLRVPDLTKASVPGAPGQFDTTAALHSLHLDALRAACGSFAITQKGEHSRWFVMGDTSVGGIFDFFGKNHSHFDSLALAPSTAFSYAAYSVDLSAVYKSVRSAATSAFPQDQAASIPMIEGMAAMRLGTPVTDAIALFGGEIAVIQLDPDSISPSQMFAMSISDPDKVSALVRKYGSDSLVEDSHENGVTLFKSKPAADSSAANPTDPPIPPSYYAVTPHFLLYGSDKKTLLKAAQSDFAAGTSRASSLTDNPEISTMRAGLPPDLLALSITDYSRENWAAVIVKSMTETDKSDTSKLSPEDIQFFDAVKKFSASALAKIMLRKSVSGWWKDADGIHYEGLSQ